MDMLGGNGEERLVWEGDRGAGRTGVGLKQAFQISYFIILPKQIW